MVDVLSVVLRALSFVLLFQAAGAALFAVLFGQPLTASLPRMWRLARAAAVAGIVAVAGHGALEPARMAGELQGVLDPALERLFLGSSAGVACLLRIVSLVLIACAGRHRGVDRLLVPAGTGLAVLSFLVMGHTATSPLRPLLAPLLAAHLAVVTFWCGALWPLHEVTRLEPPAVAGRTIASFSRVAAWLVGAMFLAALGIAVALVPGPSVLRQPYGELLLSKVVLFIALLVLASLNKWRFGPRVAASDPGAAASLRRSIVAEYVLLTCALSVTAVMTAWYSPSA